MSEEKTNFFLNETEKYTENIDKNTIINLYKNNCKNLNDEDKLFIMNKIINKNSLINEELFDILIRDLNFNFGDIILYTLEKYNNKHFFDRLNLFKKYINLLDKIQLNELLIKSIKYDLGTEFNEYLINLGADNKILDKKIKSNLTFYSKNPKLFREKSSKSCSRDRVLIKYLMDELGHPERKIHNLIHITGSNGKGSTCHFLKYILEENGYKVNVYTNPSVLNYSENYILNGVEITDEKYDELMFLVKETYDKVILRDDYKKAVEEADSLDLLRKKDIHDSKYNGVLIWCFAIAVMILAFSENDADFSIVEVRNGGLNDMTNIFSENETIATVLTYIQYGIGSNDGTMPIYDKNGKAEYSNRATAYHKAMLGKKGAPMIVANQTEDVLAEIRRVAKNEVKTKTVEFGRDWFIKNENKNSFVFEGFGKKIKINKSKTLFENFQTKNIATAMATLYKLQEQGKLMIDDNTIQNGVDKTKINGRLHRVLEGNFVDYFNNNNLEIITGFIKFNEGGVDDFIDILGKNEYNYIIYTSNAPKIMKNDLILFEKLRNKNNFKLIIYGKNKEIFEYIKKQVEKNGLDYVIKMNLSSALSFVKENLIEEKEKTRLFVVCESMSKFDINIEYMN